MFKSVRIRRRLSCVLAPIMIAYTFFPYIPSYGGEETRVITTEQASLSSETASDTVSNDKEALDKAKAAAEEINKSEGGKLLGASQNGASPSDSFASNCGVNAQVNPANGQLNLSFTNITLPGICKDMDINLGLSCNGEQNSPFMLPSKWKFNIDYIKQSGDCGKLFMNNGQNYKIHPTYQNKNGYCSGLLYYPNESVKFVNTCKGNNLPAGYGSSDQYRYILTMHDGSHEYFDWYGNLICVDDRFGNHILYKYDKVQQGYDPTPYNVRLLQIIDSYGQAINVKYTGDGNHPLITITMPDNRTVTYDFTSGGKITIKDMNGRETVVTLQDLDNKVKSITYPSGAIVTYDYKDAIPVYFKGDRSQRKTSLLKGIDQVTEDPGNGGAQIVTTYYYRRNGDCNFTGYSTYELTSDKDSLFESEYNIYTYTTEITRKVSSANGGDITTSKTFNHLHLPVEEKVEQNGVLKSDTVTKYIGQDINGDFDQYNNLPANYNLPKKVTTTTSGKSGQRTHAVDTNYDNYGQTTSVSQYDNGAITADKKTTYFDNGLVSTQTETDYLENGNAISIINTLSGNGKYIASIKASRDGSNAKEVISIADDYGRLISKTLKCAAGSGTPSSTTTTSYTRDGNNLTITTTDGRGHSISKITDITNGRITKEIDARKFETTYEYNGLKVKKIYPDGSWETEDQSDANLVINESSNSAMKWTYLDGFGNTVKEMDNLGSGGAKQRLVSSAIYNELGKPASTFDLFGHETAYTYNDYQGRETSEKDKFLGNEKTTEYDDALQLATVSINGIKAAMNKYDDQGNVLETVGLISGNPESGKTPCAVSKYNGKQEQIESGVVITDGGFSSGNGNLADGNMSYDIDGKLVKSATTTIDGAEIEMTWERDIFGNALKKVTNYKKPSPGVDMSGEFTSEIRVYDDLDHLTQVTNAEDRSIFFDYDENGNVKYMTDYSGRKFEYVYDNMGRQTEMNYIEGGEAGKDSLSVKTEYWPAGTKTKEGQIHYKRLFINGELADEITYDYDTRGLLSMIKYKDGKSMSMDYDDYGRLWHCTDYAGIESTYGYDANSNLSSVLNQYGSAEYTYYTKGEDLLLGEGKAIKKATYKSKDNKIVQAVNYEYYPSAQKGKSPALKSIETTDSSGRSVSKSVYSYDDMGRVNSIEQTSAVAKVKDNDKEKDDVNCNNLKVFTHNIMGQLIKEVVYNIEGIRIRTTDFTYDIKGNIVKTVFSDGQNNTVSSEQCIYDDDNKMLSLTETLGGITTKKDFDYDDNGSLTAIKVNSNPIKKFEYNMFNQLIKHTDAQGNEVKYDYYADNMRKDKYCVSGENKKMTYYYSSGGDILNEKSGSGASEIMSSYLIGGERVLRAVSDKVEFYVKNNKDVMGTVGEDGILKNKYQYTAYGEDTNLNNTDKIKNQNPEFDINDNPFKYSGYYSDSESGLYYLKARYYSPELKRFISRDTTDLMNKYAYGDGDPIGNSDPEGHNAITDLIAGILATIIAVVVSVVTAGAMTSVAAVSEGAVLGAMVAPTYSVAEVAGMAALAGGLSYAGADAVGQGVACATVDDYKFNWQELAIGTVAAEASGAAEGASVALKSAGFASTKGLTKLSTPWLKAVGKEGALDFVVWGERGVNSQTYNLAVTQTTDLKQFGINVGLSLLCTGFINNAFGNRLVGKFVSPYFETKILNCTEDEISKELAQATTGKWLGIMGIRYFFYYTLTSMPGTFTNNSIGSAIDGKKRDWGNIAKMSAFNGAGLNNGGLYAGRIAAGWNQGAGRAFAMDGNGQLGSAWWGPMMKDVDPLVDNAAF